MPSYSRYRPMSPSGSSQRIEGLNAFGQPFRGRKIRGVGAEERAVGRAYGRELANAKGGLWERGDGSQGNFAARKIAENEQKQADYAERKRMEAIERGRAAAAAAAAPSKSATSGQLISTGPGRSKWQTRQQLDSARVAARKKTQFVGPPEPLNITQKNKAKDRAWGRARANAERSVEAGKSAAGNDPAGKEKFMRELARSKLRDEFQMNPRLFNGYDKRPTTAAEWDAVQ